MTNLEGSYDRRNLQKAISLRLNEIEQNNKSYTGNGGVICTKPSQNFLYTRFLSLVSQTQENTGRNENRTPSGVTQSSIPQPRIFISHLFDGTNWEFMYE